MSDLLRDGLTWLEQQRTAHCSSQVTYRREATELLVNATFGRTEYEVADEYSGGGATIRAHVVDFLILAEELSPTFGEPKAGDQIVADGRIYEVMALSGQGHWRWSDPYRTTYRIHTKDVGPAA
jgi:hypothetical protein